VHHFRGDVAGEAEDEVTGLSDGVRPFPPKDNGGVRGDSVKFPLDRLSDVAGVAFAERVFDLPVIDSPPLDDDDVCKTGRGVRVSGFDLPGRVTFLNFSGLLGR
jgi:hypothetical protein